jgi:hypothetical protein
LQTCSGARAHSRELGGARPDHERVFKVKSPSRLIDKRINELGDWRGPEVVEDSTLDDDALKTLICAAVSLERVSRPSSRRNEAANATYVR